MSSADTNFPDELPEDWITDDITYQFARSCFRYIVNADRSRHLVNYSFDREKLTYYKSLVSTGEDLLFVIQPDEPNFGFMCDGGSPDTSWLTRTDPHEAFGVPEEPEHHLPSFHKLVINSFGDPDISPPYTETDKESHPLRFEQYQRIKFSTGKEGRDRWKLGTVSRLYYRESGWLPGYCAYQFQDDDGDYRFAPKDTDEFIRDAHGKGGRARRSPSVKKDVWFLFGRNCLHPRHVTWKGGDLGIADQSTFSAAESFIVNGTKGLKESVLSQWKSLSKESRFRIVTKFAELVFKMREDFLKARITRPQVELLIPELYSKEGKERLVESGDMKLMMDLLDHACECGYCVEKTCRESGIFAALEERNISKLLVECKCPCPKVHTRESFIIDTNGRGYCIDGGNVVDGCFSEMWGSSRRFIIGNFFTNFGFFASSDFIAREEAGEGLIDSLARDLGKISPLSSTQTPGITSGSSATEQQKCNVCGKTGIPLSRCSKCKVVFYCGREHQLSDWPAHKPQCRVIRKSREAQGT